MLSKGPFLRTLLLLLLLGLARTAESFLISPPTFQTSRTKLPMSSCPQESSTRVEQQLPAWITQPTRKQENAVVNLEDAELIVGRIAMVGAVFLLAREVFTGESFLEQFAETIGTLMN